MENPSPFQKIKEANEQAQAELQTTEMTGKMLTIEQKLNALQQQANDLQHCASTVEHSLSKNMADSQQVADQAKALIEAINALNTAVQTATTTLHHLPKNINETVSTILQQAVHESLQTTTQTLSEQNLILLQSLTTQEIKAQLEVLIQETLESQIQPINTQMAQTIELYLQIVENLDREYQNINTAANLPQTIFKSVWLALLPLVVILFLTALIPFNPTIGQIVLWMTAFLCITTMALIGVLVLAVKWGLMKKFW